MRIYGYPDKNGIAALVIVMGMQFAVYAPIYKADRARLDKVRKRKVKENQKLLFRDFLMRISSHHHLVWKYGNTDISYFTIFHRT